MACYLWRLATVVGRTSLLYLGGWPPWYGELECCNGRLATVVGGLACYTWTAGPSSREDWLIRIVIPGRLATEVGRTNLLYCTFQADHSCRED
jgi:hypothetical protein